MAVTQSSSEGGGIVEFLALGLFGVGANLTGTDWFYINFFVVSSVAIAMIGTIVFSIIDR